MSKPSNFTGGPNDRISHPCAGRRDPGVVLALDNTTMVQFTFLAMPFRSRLGLFMLLPWRIGVLLGILLMVPASGRRSWTGECKAGAG